MQKILQDSAYQKTEAHTHSTHTLLTEGFGAGGTEYQERRFSALPNTGHQVSKRHEETLMAWC